MGTHEITGTAEGVAVQNDGGVLKVTAIKRMVYRCSEGDLETEDLTEVAKHAVAAQFNVRFHVD